MQTPDEMTPAHPEFWDAFYDSGEGSNGVYEWFMEWSEYRTPIMETLPMNEPHHVQILHVGCGNSEFPERVYEEWRGGPATLTSIDICEKVVADMKSGKKKKGKKKGLSLEWMQMDCCRLDSTDEYYDYIFDKGTVDALLSQCDDLTESEGNPNVFAYFREAYRTLKHGGTFVLITINATEVILPYALGADGDCTEEHSDLFDWSNETHVITARAPKGKKQLTVHSHGGFHTVFIFRKP